MSKAIVFEGLIPTSDEFNWMMKDNSLDIASTILVDGGPRNSWEQAFVDYANIAGNTLQEIEIAAKQKRPKLTNLQ